LAILGCSSNADTTSLRRVDTGDATGVGGSGGGAGNSAGSGGVAGSGSTDAGGDCARFDPVPPNPNTGELSGRLDGLVPLPKSLQAGQGEFPLSPGTPIFLSVATSEALARVAGRLRSLLERATGYPIPIAHSGDICPSRGMFDRRRPLISL
jgi:hypothetical protein